MSAQLAIAEPRRIKATHRRRRKIASGRFVQRYYDPGLGRFLSTDPAESEFNRYNYASNNPYRFTDPDGREAADRAYGFAVGIMLRDNPEAMRIWARGEAAAGTEGSFAEQGAAMGQATGAFIDKGDYSAPAASSFVKSAVILAITHKKGARTEPTLPKKQIASGEGVKVEHNYKSGDHGPAHAHVTGGGETTRIGANGKPLSGQPELSSAQKGVVDQNKSVIRSAINKIGRWLDFHENK